MGTTKINEIKKGIVSNNHLRIHDYSNNDYSNEKSLQKPKVIPMSTNVSPKA
jgi:hypothetical protein